MQHDHVAEVRRFLTLEAEAIARTAARLDQPSVESAIALLSACRGKVITTGIGKSGNIAQKVAATMTSTGTPALYLHPSDALHGGLGMVGPDDVVIAISNSGETDEIIAMLPSLKRRNVPVIAILGDLASTLARRADVVLDASVDKEACPFNLAPTASTSVALALGDALALTLMQLKGLTPEEFALNHPAGRLGKRLTLRVGDLMHSGEQNPTIGPDATLLDAVRAITRGGLGAVNVVDERRRLIGLITDGDLRRAFERSHLADLAALRCSAVMTRTPVVVSPATLAYDALRLMEDRPSQISVLPVVEADGTCIGLIRLHDIVRSGL
ncbi:MAG: KpsF/GutQ family sugar-phosphate isomerase [Pyrinomonas sp.]|uniref:KpsF/GutQ family sugar-phosphate isomerase n=1 Tax=Pyrinomonas sp. TaxID=2080306 RepID=UPI00332D5C05